MRSGDVQQILGGLRYYSPLWLYAVLTPGLDRENYSRWAKKKIENIQNAFV